jgi:LuxR family maltose regulon positive regulatory protein
VRSFEFSAALLQGTFAFDGLGPMREAGQRAIGLETDTASPWHALAHSAFGAALYWSGEFEQAAAHAEEGLLGKASMSIVLMLSSAVMALLSADAGRPRQAGEFAQTAYDMVSDPGLGLGNTAQGSLGYLAMGAVHAAQGNLGVARDELERALQVRQASMGLSPWPTVEIMFRLAPVLADLGDGAGAGTLLGEARQILTSLPDGADAQLARLGQLERRLSYRPLTPPGEPITERERDVLRLLQGTLSLRDIGRELYLSPNTIKTHTRALYRKLGVSDRQDAVAKARQLGLM